jgi:hypothetical protein
MQVISRMEHFDKAPNNALLAKTVSECSSKGIEYLTYGAYSYRGNGGTSSLTDFKRANGFFEMEVPRYYVPLTLKGALTLKTGLHRERSMILPAGITDQLVKLRAALSGLKKKV